MQAEKQVSACECTLPQALKQSCKGGCRIQEPSMNMLSPEPRMQVISTFLFVNAVHLWKEEGMVDFAGHPAPPHQYCQSC